MINQFIASNPVIVGFMSVNKGTSATDALASIQRAFGELVLHGCTDGMGEIRQATVEIRPIDNDSDLAIIRAISRHDFTPIMNQLLKSVVDAKQANMAVIATSTIAQCAARFVFTEYDEAPVESFKNAVYRTLTDELKHNLHKVCAKPSVTWDDVAEATARPGPVYSSFYPSNVIHDRIKLMNESGIISDGLAQAFNHGAIRAFMGITDQAVIDEVIKELNDKLDRIELEHSSLKKKDV